MNIPVPILKAIFDRAGVLGLIKAAVNNEETEVVYDFIMVSRRVGAIIVANVLDRLGYEPVLTLELNEEIRSQLQEIIDTDVDDFFLVRTHPSKNVKSLIDTLQSAEDSLEVSLFSQIVDTFMDDELHADKFKQTEMQVDPGAVIESMYGYQVDEADDGTQTFQFVGENAKFLYYGHFLEKLKASFTRVGEDGFKLNKAELRKAFDNVDEPITFDPMDLIAAGVCLGCGGDPDHGDEDGDLGIQLEDDYIVTPEELSEVEEVILGSATRFGIELIEMFSIFTHLYRHDAVESVSFVDEDEVPIPEWMFDEDIYEGINMWICAIVISGTNRYRAYLCDDMNLPALFLKEVNEDPRIVSRTMMESSMHDRICEEYTVLEMFYKIMELPSWHRDF